MLRLCRVVAGFTLLLLCVSASVAQSKSQKQYGPTTYFYTYQSGATYFLSGDFTVNVQGSRKNPTVYLTYHCSYSDWSSGQNWNETFDGMIPATSLTWSGQPEFNGNFTANLAVDTSTMSSSAGMTKTGNGGLLLLTWTQDSAGTVNTTVGTTTFENASSIDKANGKVVFMPGIVNGSFFQIPVDGTPPNYTYSYMMFYDQTLTSHVLK